MEYANCCCQMRSRPQNKFITKVSRSSRLRYLRPRARMSATTLLQVVNLLRARRKFLLHATLIVWITESFSLPKSVKTVDCRILVDQHIYIKISFEDEICARNGMVSPANSYSLITPTGAQHLFVYRAEGKSGEGNGRCGREA
eukprot:Gb_23304 [translate_table: standard]